MKFTKQKITIVRTRKVYNLQIFFSSKSTYIDFFRYNSRLIQSSWFSHKNRLKYFNTESLRDRGNTHHFEMIMERYVLTFITDLHHVLHRTQLRHLTNVYVQIHLAVQSCTSTWREIQSRNIFRKIQLILRKCTKYDIYIYNIK